MFITTFNEYKRFFYSKCLLYIKIESNKMQTLKSFFNSCILMLIFKFVHNPNIIRNGNWLFYHIHLFEVPIVLVYLKKLKFFPMSIKIIHL